jgi:phage repressor protein C with HTH and peptisase S24 domain
MFNGNVQTFEPVLNKDKSLHKVPLFELEASAGFSTLYQDSPELVTDYITIPNLPPVDGAIYAKGDSMAPLIASGDIVIFKKVELLPDNILWGHIYIVSYTIDGDSFTVLKYVRKSTCSGCVRLESFNVRYDPQDIPANSITALALVKASITFHTIG